MPSPLLATKVRIPPRARHLVPRARLVEQLEREIPRSKLVLISTPAGYGKTTLVSQWARASRLPVAWLSLGEDDNDVERFFRYLLAAWEQVQPGIGESSLGLLLGAIAPDRQDVLTAFLQAAEGLDDHLVIVLDDAQVVVDEAILRALSFLLDHLPPALHFVLATRAEPNLPIARYRARQELVEIDANDLRFDQSEAEVFLNQVMRLDLPGGQLATLQRQLEGWIAGLQLVALSMQRHGPGALEPELSGRQRFIADFLSHDVLANQPEDVRRFLLQTSILDGLSAPLCRSVTGRGDAQVMLERLERENLFLLPLDDGRTWYRYHHTFAGFLEQELKRSEPEAVHALHRRAARWFFDQNMPEPAFDHTLRAYDLDLMIEIYQRHMFVMLHGGEFTLLGRWLDALPEAWYAAYPAFGLVRAGMLAFSGALDACAECVDDVDQRLQDTNIKDRDWQRARVTALRCFIACFRNDLEGAESLAAQALRDLPEDDISFRADVYHALGDTFRRNGRWEPARGLYLKVLDFARAPTFRSLAPHVYGALADLELRRGRLRDAADYWQHAQAAVDAPENWGRVPLPVAGWVYIRLGEIHYEWNELDAAWDYLRRGLERAKLGGDVRGMLAGYVIAGRIQLARGDLDVAANYLEEARPLLRDAPLLDWAAHFERVQLHLWLAQDRLRAAVNWADEVLDGEGSERPEPEIAQLSAIRVLLIKGDAMSSERATRLAGELLQAAESQGRQSIQIEALALLALGQWQLGERASALKSVERALQLAEPEGYVRLFTDHGPPMARLLQEARSRQVVPDYVPSLLASFGDSPSGADPPTDPLPEPLTAREREVLRHVAAGLTNREIAEELNISPQTVKKHAGNIFGKLGVRGRVEAAAHARALDLLG